LIAARAEMMENDAERGAARATRAATTKRRIAGARRKASLAVTAGGHVRPSGQAFVVARDGKGLEQLTNDLRALAPALIVREATGGFEITVAAALAGGRLVAG
jgi:hypothetical protein